MNDERERPETPAPDPGDSFTGQEDSSGDKRGQEEPAGPGLPSQSSPGSREPEDLKEESSRTPEPPKGPVCVVGVKFKRAGKEYFFDAGSLRFNIGDRVVVETERGLALARVVSPVFELEPEEVPPGLKRVIRKATWNDLERERKNREREEQAKKLCVEEIRRRGLKMKLVEVEYLHDMSKAIFYFTAEQRVDFRDLVRELARKLHTRIEMRQVGVRDEVKMLGGIGPCGREVCCATFLAEFSPVSVRMAKEQNLAMNPAKVSGLCGRLMCCLSYEHELYHEYCKLMPKKRRRMMSPEGPCRVVDLNILAKKAFVELESGKTMFIEVEKLRPLDEQPGEPQPPSPEEEFPEEDAPLLDTDDPSVLEKLEDEDICDSASEIEPPPGTRPVPEDIKLRMPQGAGSIGRESPESGAEGAEPKAPSPDTEKRQAKDRGKRKRKKKKKKKKKPRQGRAPGG